MVIAMKLRCCFAALAAALLAQGHAMAQGWAPKLVDDPFAKEIVRSASIDLRTYCYGKGSSVKIAAFTPRAGGKTDAELVVRLDGMRVANRITEVAVRDVGPLRLLSSDSGNVSCGRFNACRMEYVASFQVTPEQLAAMKAGDAEVRVRSNDPAECEFTLTIPATAWTGIGL